MFVWEYLGDQHPDHGTLANRMCRNEHEYTGRHDTEMRGEKRPRHQAQRNDVPKGAYEQQSAAAELVDEPQTQERKYEVGQADTHRLQQGGLFGQSGHLENARREIQHRIDAGQLIEQRDQHGKQNRRAQIAGPETN